MKESSESRLTAVLTSSKQLNMMVFLVFLASTMALVVSDSSITTSLMQDVGTCEMNCEHGVCEMVQGGREKLQLLFQSGMPLQRCVCPYGWTGTGCELEVEQCDINTHTCPNGFPCDTNQYGANNCDCSIADSLSKAAGRQCRRPYTDYCSSTYDPNKPLSFCTNGGVCRASVMAAKESPGNTTVNSRYEHEGCICPPEYYGPHCEFIHRTVPSSSVEQEQIVEPATEKPSSSISAPKDSPLKTETGSSNNIQDLIRGYDESGGDRTKNEKSEDASESDNKVMKGLLGFLGFLGFVGLGCLFLRFRKHNKKQAFIPKTATSTDSVATKSVTTTDSIKNSYSKKQRVEKGLDMPMAHSLPVHHGVADLTPFTLDNEAEGELTSSTWDYSSQFQDVMATSNEASGGWVAAVSQHIDTFVGTRCQLPREYVVDDDDDDIVSDIYSVVEEQSHEAYVVAGDCDDDGMSLFFHEENRHQPRTSYPDSFWGDWD